MELVLKKALELFGFGEKPAKWWAWVALVSVVVAGVIFYLSFSVAKYRRMVGQLRAKVIEQDTRLKNKEHEKTVAVLQERNKHLDVKKAKDAKARKLAEAEIERARIEIAAGQARVDKEVAKLKGKSMKELLKQSKTLMGQTWP